MRIVQLTDQYLPAIGGTERHVARLAQALTARGHSLAVVTLARPGLPQHETDEHGVTVIRVDAPEVSLLRRGYRSADASFHPPMPLPGTARALRRAIRDFGADVVHGHNWLTYPALAVKRSLGAPVVHTLHDYSGVCPKMTLLRPDGSVCSGPSLRACVPCAATQYARPVAAGMSVALRAGTRLHGHIDRVLAVSELVAAAQRPAFPQPVEVVPTFIADGLAARHAHATRPAFVPDGPYLLYVGQLTPHKGLPVLLEAHRLLGPDAPPLVLCGVRKPSTPDLSGYDNVVVRESVPHDDVMAAWVHATVGVVPSLSESWGQVVAEALTVGCPVVVSDAVGLAPQVAAADAGAVVPVGDPAALSHAVGALLEDPARVERYKVNGRRLAATLTVSSVVGQLEEIFTQAVDTHRAKAPR